MSDNLVSKQKTKIALPCFSDSDSMKWDSLNSVILALTFIWAGLVFLGDMYGHIIGDPWLVFFTGAGSLILIEIAIRLLYPVYNTSILGHLIWAGFLFWLAGWDIILPIMIVTAGIYILYITYADKFFNREN